MTSYCTLKCTLFLWLYMAKNVFKDWFPFSSWLGLAGHTGSWIGMTFTELNLQNFNSKFNKSPPNYKNTFETSVKPNLKVCLCSCIFFLLKNCILYQFYVHWNVFPYIQIWVLAHLSIEIHKKECKRHSHFWMVHSPFLNTEWVLLTCKRRRSR